MVDVLRFQGAITDSSRFKKRHLLLGNGFSIACRPRIFSYGSLFEQADFSSAPNLQAVFDAVETTDFEHVIRMLEDASLVVPVYSSAAAGIARQMAGDAKNLKDILIRTVAGNHPGIPNEIEDLKFQACRRFLAYFLGAENKHGKVYTLNYDLLLYWTLMHDDMGFDEPIDLAVNDGFGRGEDTEPEFVTWMGESSANRQRVYYLHGALHLFDAGAELQKYTWVNTGRPLLDQAREAMDSRKFPLFVAEGKSNQKLAKIKHSAYLYHAYKSFSSQMTQNNDALFIFGHSLADNDQHILKKIARGKVPQIYVSLYGDPDSSWNRPIREAATALTRSRGEENPLAVTFFDAASAEVWGT
ncbi:DUF4917 family protein [uncultured Tistrella sp.]|uniref:DUF4917 family protein n=1 Tax=Tistrella mobilis TaxID=171437 RepID=UPI000C0911E0|nr:DUF4917 family protein [uncultured Tistrella sp.]MAM74759.1 DUF4917 domain-containing protein [Tistrella sp.]|tara:strand:+ start:643 stop:1713 length:1071 start_codon:yes stop_codon:yes gene_type:complete